MELEFRIKKRFEKFALHVDVTAGEGVTGLLGASGCGKSMTLKCVAGIVTPDEGRIVLNHRILFDSDRNIDLPPQQRRVGYLFQHYALFPNMTVTQNIAAGMGKKEADTIRGLLTSFRLEELADKFPRQLSGGQQQRVALARILASKPEALLLDEPFSALDSYLKWQVELDMSDRLRDFGGPVIFVTHDREEVYRLCGNAYVLNHGRSQPGQTVRKLFQSPETLSACLLSGCKNVSRARILPDGRVDALDWGAALTVAAPIPKKLAYVGVRSHHLRPAAGGEENVIPCRVRRVLEELFSSVALLEPLGGGPEAALLRLELSAEEWAALDGVGSLTVAVPPEKVMLLQE